MLAALVAIALLHWAVLLVPGFNFVLIGRLAAGGSRPAALAAVAGMTAGTLAWATLAVAGVGVVFAAHPGLRLAAQVAGGLYLMHLALKLWRAGGPAREAGGAVMGRAAAFRTGFGTSMLNPKIALFYGSVFATALPPEPAPLLVLAAVALVFANSLLWHTTLAFALSSTRVQQAWLRHGRAFNRVSAGLVGAYGAKLLVSTLQEARSRMA